MPLGIKACAGAIAAAARTEAAMVSVLSMVTFLCFDCGGGIAIRHEDHCSPRGKRLYEKLLFLLPLAYFSGTDFVSDRRPGETRTCRSRLEITRSIAIGGNCADAGSRSRSRRRS